MATVGILPLAEPGHINATLRLWSELTELGHDVRYVALASDGQDPPGLQLFREQRLPLVTLTITDAPRATDVTVDLGGFRPDVVLIDAFNYVAAVLAWSKGIPVIKMSSTFPQRHDPSIPPLTTSLAPAGSAAHQSEIDRAWQVEHERNVQRRSGSIRHLTDKFGFPRDLIDDRSAIEVSVALPELTLVPSALDFPRQRQDGLFYAGPCVDLSRSEATVSWLDALPADRPLVYCSFGSQEHRYPLLHQRRQLVIDAARLLPDCQFVLVGDASSLARVPPNVRVVPMAPQIAVLRRAAVMLSHGGLNGIKEALCLGVPLIVLPFDIDQPGNAARVAFHGLGVAMDWADATAEALGAAIQDIIQDDALSRRVSEFSTDLVSAIDERHAARAFRQCFEQALAAASARGHSTLPLG